MTQKEHLAQYINSNLEWHDTSLITRDIVDTILTPKDKEQFLIDNNLIIEEYDSNCYIFTKNESEV